MPASAPVGAESDFSARKLKIAMAILVGQTFATSLLPFGAFSLVMIPLTRQFGWSREDFSFAQTFTMIFGAVSLWPIGRLSDRFGVRPVILGGTVIVGLVTLALSLQTRSLAQLYLCYALLGVFGSTGVAYTKLAAALFTQNRGKALAILGAESTVATAIVPLMINAMLLELGWRGMYLGLGILILAIAPLLYVFLEEPGRERSRRREVPPGGPDAGTHPVPPVLPGMTVKQALHDRVFWLMAIGLLAGFPIAAGMMAHMVPALIGKGFSETEAVEMTSVFMLAGLGGTLLGGFLADRFHTAKIAAPFNLVSALSGLGLVFVTGSWGGLGLLAAAMAAGGFSFNGFRPMGTYFHTRYFGLRSFTEIFSVEFTMTTVATAFSAPLIGALFDHTHSYRLAFELMAAAPLVSGVIWLVLPKYRYAADIGALPPPR